MAERNHDHSPPPETRAALEAFHLQALRYLDGLQTDEEARLLNAQLESTAEYREYFAALSVEMGILNELLLPNAARDEGGSLFGANARAAAEPGNPSGTSTSTGRTPKSAVRVWGLALAATLLVSALGAWLWRADLRENRHAGVSPDMQGSAEIFNTRLESGNTSRFTLPGVGYVILEGPAEFRMLEPKRARLNSGRIKMRVTEQTGHGFVVETPYGEVTDLGTEFGLDVSDKGKAGLVVFEGEVDLRVADQQVPQSSAYTRVERLVGGDGVTFDGGGQLDRIMSIVTGKSATFRPGNQSHEEGTDPLIAGISDNLRASDTMRFYEIVRGGFGEDARAYVDRSYEWNGVDENGLPSFLVGADYILPFNDDKGKRLSIALSLERPTTVYILFDDRGTPPKWLTDKFVRTGFKVGMDEDQGPPSSSRPSLKTDRGPAKSIDYTFSVWKQDVTAPGKIELGSREGPKGSRSMYGIVVAPLNTTPLPAEPDRSPIAP